jgi:hypothetical protein
MAYEPRTISYLDRDERFKHYGIALHDRVPRPALAAATRKAASEVVPDGAVGFTIAHDGATAGLALVYWWDNENEIHHRFFSSSFDDLGNLSPYDGTGFSCVWEMEVIDFERRAWLEDVLKGDDTGRYLQRTLEEVEV